MPDTIRLATTAVDFAAMAGLVTDYVAWCRERYRDHPGFIDRVFGHQALDGELKTLTAAYSAPLGKALLASRGDQVVGTVAYRTLGDEDGGAGAGACEMKRLFVSSRRASPGTGRRLCAAVIASARDDGYRIMRLDTGKLMTEAIGLYESLGFRRCPAYHDYPAELMPFLVFMERPL